MAVARTLMWHRLSLLLIHGFIVVCRSGVVLHGSHRDALVADDTCRTSSSSCSVNALQRSMELAGHAAQTLASSPQSSTPPSPQVQLGNVSNPNSTELNRSVKRATPSPQVAVAASNAEVVLDSAAGEAAKAMDDVNRSLMDTAKNLGVEIPAVIADPDETIDGLQKKMQDEAVKIATKASERAWNQSKEDRMATFGKLDSMNETVQGGMKRVEAAVSKAESAINSLERELNSTGLSMRSFAQGILARGAAPAMISVALAQWLW
eukprot:TRINITY_DN12519_c0_g1_i1.p1 TRINITY_DN12519_c0_g1~~TRINITY_DN12519_c0_g1_i1.p1  ORF type:complete len:273 (+),score=55.84 TRINITY_DN12519_c0_g1_i1:30-821(+)